MLNIRYKERTNTWPGFVDLFSNLVIILIFLLIVFVFLWTTTSVFNKNSGLAAIAGLRKTTTEQAETIAQMTADEQEAKRLLIMARGELENLESDKAVLVNEIGVLDTELQKMDMGVEELITSYEGKVRELQSVGQNMDAKIAEMNAQIVELNIRLGQAQMEKAQTIDIEQQRRELQSQMDAQRANLTDELARLNAALDAANEKAAANEIQYVEMSNQLNRALADKIAELSQVDKYQSAFYKAIKLALGDKGGIQQDGDRFIVSSDILFASGEYRLSPEGKNQLRLIANVINDLERTIPNSVNWIVRVDGHTDKQPVKPGTTAYRTNTELSLLRATAVAKELAADGVPVRRLIPSGFGEEYPVSHGTDNASLQKNRRIELQLTNR